MSKLSAEHLCRLFNDLYGLPVVVLRTARFFPEEDDMAHAIAQSGENTKANELLFRRATVEDMAEAHVAALVKAPELGFDIFIISAKTPLHARRLRGADPPTPQRWSRGCSRATGKFMRAGVGRCWTSIDRVCRFPGRPSGALGFVAQHGICGEAGGAGGVMEQDRPAGPSKSSAKRSWL